METLFQKIRKNFSYLLVSEILIRGMMLILTIYLAQRYTPEKLGVYTLALSMGNLFEIIFNMGLGTVFLQRVSDNTEKMEEELAIFLPLRLILCVVSFLLYAVFIFALQKSPETFFALLYAGMHFTLFSFTSFLWACFDAKQKMHFTAIAKLMMYPLIFGLGIYFTANMQSISTILATYVLGAIVSLLFTTIIVRKKFCRFRFKIDTKQWKGILKAGLPIALAGTFVFIYNYLDTLIISMTHGEEAVGLYHAGYKIVGTLFILASIINQAYLPTLIQTSKSHEKINAVFQKALNAAFFWSIPITVGGLILAERIILFVYGTQYIASIAAFQILLWNCLIYFLSSAMINLMYGLKEQNSVMKVFFIGAVINTVSNLFIIPVWGIEGAAATTLGAEMVVLVGIYLHARKKVRIQIFSENWRVFIAVTIMTLALVFVHFESLLLTIGFGAIVYFASHAALSKARLSHAMVSISKNKDFQSESLPKENP